MKVYVQLGDAKNAYLLYNTNIPRVPAVALDVVHAAADIDPDDPVNISARFAFELTHAAPHNTRANDLAL